MTDWGYRAAAILARRLPRSWSDFLANATADLYVWTHPRLAGAVDRRLAALGGSGPIDTTAPFSARSTYRAFARAVRDFLRGPEAGRETPNVTVDPGTRAILDRARADGRPTLVLSGHFGPWEVALGWLAREVGPLEALAAPHARRSIQRFFEGRRAATGVRTLAGDSTAMRALAALRDGRWLAALADRACSPRRRLTGLAGCVPIDCAPLLLARRAGARILAGVSWRGDDGAIHVRLLEPFTLAPGHGGLSLAQGARRLQRFFDAHVRAHPTQWYEWAAGVPGGGSVGPQ